MASFSFVVGSELTALPRRLGGSSGALFFLILFAVFGYLLPAGMGADFLDPHLIVLYACSAPFFLAPVVAESFSDAPPAGSSSSTLAGKVLVSCVFGWACSLLLLTLGLLSLNFQFWNGAMVLPRTSFLLWVALLGFSMSLFTVSLAAALSLSARAPKTVRLIIRRGYAWLLVALIIVARFGLLEWREAFTSLLTAEGIARLSGYGSLLLLAASAATLTMVARHPRYSGPVSQS
jgi:hypothetical protein